MRAAPNPAVRGRGDVVAAGGEGFDAASARHTTAHTSAKAASAVLLSGVAAGDGAHGVGDHCLVQGRFGV